MSAHILLTSEHNFDVCVRRGVYGCVMPRTEWNKAEIVAGVLSIQTDDLVFFYVKNKGIYGLWRVVGGPFFDEARVWDDEGQLFPYRVSLRPAVGHFPKPVSLSDVLDLHDKGRVWTFDLNPVQQKNQYKITMDEAREIVRLLLRNNPIRVDAQSVLDPYTPTVFTPVEIDLASSQAGRVRYEGWLNAWFMRSLARGELKALLGDYQEFLNLVPTTFNKVMDVFLTHVTRVDSIDVLHKYTCVELKTDRATELDLAQILRYENWLARKLAAGDDLMIQSVLVAKSFTEAVIRYVSTRQQIEEKTVRLISYRVKDDKQGIELEEVPVSN